MINPIQTQSLSYTSKNETANVPINDYEITGVDLLETLADLQDRYTYRANICKYGVVEMGLSIRERQIVTAPATFSPANKSLYKHRLRKRLKEIQDDVTFLNDNIEQLSGIGIKIEDYSMLNCTYKMPDKLHIPHTIQSQHSDTESKSVSNIEQSSTSKSRRYQENGGW